MPSQMRKTETEEEEGEDELRVPLHPDRKCLQYETAWEDEECWGQWADWAHYCDHVDWTSQCDAIHDAWYAQDIPWVEPAAVPEECLVHYDLRSADCWDEWDRLWQQCHNEGDYERQPYYWTEQCDAMEAMELALDLYDEALGIEFDFGDHYHDEWTLEDFDWGQETL